MDFLETFAEFIINKFDKEKLGKEIQIILPNNFSCSQLKKILTDKYQNKLPIIIPFTSIISKKNLDSDYVSKLEELFILSTIITEYKELPFNIEESLKAAEILRKLFNDLIINNIDIKLIETYNNSNYWQKIYKFLEYCFLRWQEEISLTQKQSKSGYKLKLLQAEIIKIRKSHKQVILAGIFKPDPFLKKFEEELKDYIIYYNPNLATIKGNISYLELNDIYEEAKQIAYICTQNSDKKIAIITNNNKLKKIYCNYLDKYSLAFEDLIGNNLGLTNIADLLISIIKILCNNFDLKILFLLLKNPLINCPTVQKLELILSNKNRFISSPKYLLQLQFDNEDILFTDTPHNAQDILVAAKEIAEKLLPTIWEKEGGAELLEFLVNLTTHSKYINLTDKKDFPKFFSFLLSGNKYYKNIDSANIYSYEMKSGYTKINLEKSKESVSRGAERILIREHLRTYKDDVANFSSSSSIIIGSPEDLALCEFDLIILPHFNNENWPPSNKAHPWLSKKALQILNIDYGETSPTLYSDYFNLFLQNKQVIILNAKKYDGKLTTPSNLFLKLQNVIPTPLYVIPLIAGIQLNTNLDMDPRFRGDDIERGWNDIEHTALSTFFPTILSVTDIETLIRNPYGFYAKKILGLRKKDNIWEEPKISDFGNFIHKVLEEYSKNYDKQYINLNLLDKQNALINIGNHILYSTILPIYTKKAWQIKLTAFSKAFILFDIERRKNCKEIYFEIKGELQLNIAGQDIKIIGIADRIEISKSNNITILDYKTGAIPTKKEIELGLSPQLIIESLMLLENGFSTASFSKLDTSEFSDIRLCSRTFVRSAGSVVNSSCLKLAESSCINKEITIAYVKITSTEPYIQTAEIALSIETLNRHKAGLVKLLEHYITNKFFSYDLDLSKYNDYLHLSR